MTRPEPAPQRERNAQERRQGEARGKRIGRQRDRHGLRARAIEGRRQRATKMDWLAESTSLACQLAHCARRLPRPLRSVRVLLLGAR
jgi:hypothetical protein